MTWSTSNRRSRLPKDWPAIRARILTRDRHRCYRCGRPATEVDHKQRGDDHSDANLGAICTPCHRTKSSREGGQATRWRRPPRRRRPDERHPGLR
ncbi:5-methylcytosine-specific restriction protein A [Kitasatospora gansuensis]|uniref:5-methylcytosine-specific restriction protein A n=1 Tax=Kitasatospora gansuensis TaxID=258050 RepID=A0A7W7SI07_9ACTN|nr:HNH endonuclease [Kitasatospora gansuensis]MBB4949661.1 5-methylcytosine-specific restriction protein A [Kitasatospora gansuensis]